MLQEVDSDTADKDAAAGASAGLIILEELDLALAGGHENESAVTTRRMTDTLFCDEQLPSDFRDAAIIWSLLKNLGALVCDDPDMMFDKGRADATE